MQITPLDNITGQLLTRLGPGRTWTSAEGCMKLTFGEMPAGPCLRLSARLGEANLTILVKETQWCDWISPILSVPGFDCVPEELYDPLAVWTMEQAATFREDLDLPWPLADTITAHDSATAMGWLIHVLRDGKEMSFGLLHAPPDWIDLLMQEMIVMHEVETPPLCVGAGLIAGWSRVSQEELKTMRPGDALMLQRSWNVRQGQFVLFLQRPLASLQQDSENGYFMTEVLMDNFDDWMDITPSVGSGNNTLECNVTVVAEVATLEMSLQALSELIPGSLITDTVKYDGLITLKAGGRVIGRGSLLQIGDGLAIRISQTG